MVSYRVVSSFHGLISGIPRWVKSRVLRVARVRSCAVAVAARKLSMTGAGLPLRSPSAMSIPQASAIGMSTVRIRSAKRGTRSASSHAARCVRRLPAGMPLVRSGSLGRLSAAG